MPLPAPESETRAWLRLGLTAGLGGEGQRKLLKQFGSPDAIIAAANSEVAAIVGHKVALALNAETQEAHCESALKWLSEKQHFLITLADGDYPPMLLETADPPVMLYAKGRRELLSRSALAIVGSRNATPGGRQTAEAFAKSLSTTGVTIVSGMALGIDTAAHLGGLEGAGSTIAVVGTGLDRIYPASNRHLAQRIAAEGLMLSEFPLGTPAMASNFPRRNRIISGLSRGVLVVEAALASGSLITASQAASQGRDVFAIPGSIHSPLSKGCHQLIKQGAKLVDDASDILNELGWLTASDNKRASADSPPAAQSPSQHPLLAVLGFDPVPLDTLVSRCQIDMGELIAQLTLLEIEGMVATLPGGKVQRLK